MGREKDDGRNREKRSKEEGRGVTGKREERRKGEERKGLGK